MLAVERDLIPDVVVRAAIRSMLNGRLKQVIGANPSSAAVQVIPCLRLDMMLPPGSRLDTK